MPIFQRIANHLTKYKSLNVVQIFQRYRNLSMKNFYINLCKHTVSSNIKAQLKQTDLDNIIYFTNAMKILYYATEHTRA